MEAFVTVLRMVPPYVSERGGLPRIVTFKAVPFGSTVSQHWLPYPIPAAPRANVPEGLSSSDLIENIAFCGPWPAAVSCRVRGSGLLSTRPESPPDRGDPAVIRVGSTGA